MTENDFKKLREIVNAVPQLDYICVDVANGYSEHFVEFVRLVRKEFPEKTIFVCLIDRDEQLSRSHRCYSRLVML